jgi:F5/8 type C domain
MPPPTGGNLVGPSGGGSGLSPMSGTEGNPTITGSTNEQLPSVAPPQGGPLDAGAPLDEAGRGSLADAAPAPSSPADPAPPPGSVRFVTLVGDSEVNGSNVACISDFNLLAPDGSLLDRTEWRPVVDSAELNYLGGAPAEQAIDEDRLSLWHTAWFELASPPGYPHFLQIDLGALVQVAGFRYLPRQSSSSGRIAAYRFFASASSDLGDGQRHFRVEAPEGGAHRIDRDAAEPCTRQCSPVGVVIHPDDLVQVSLRHERLVHLVERVGVELEAVGLHERSDLIDQGVDAREVASAARDARAHPPVPLGLIDEDSGVGDTQARGVKQSKRQQAIG